MFEGEDEGNNFLAIGKRKSLICEKNVLINYFTHYIIHGLFFSFFWMLKDLNSLANFLFISLGQDSSSIYLYNRKGKSWQTIRRQNFSFLWILVLPISAASTCIGFELYVFPVMIEPRTWHIQFYPQFPVDIYKHKFPSSDFILLLYVLNLFSLFLRHVASIMSVSKLQKLPLSKERVKTQLQEQRRKSRRRNNINFLAVIYSPLVSFQSLDQ